MFEKNRSEKPSIVILVALLAIANLWYDYYHPVGLLFDIIIAIFLLKYLVTKPLDGGNQPRR